MKEIKRTKKIKHLYFQSGNKIKKIHYKNFLKRNKIHDLIKLTPQEFILAIKKKLFFTLIYKQVYIKKKKIII